MQRHEAVPRSLSDLWRRSVKPTALIYQGAVTRPARRVTGMRSPREVELFIAFDDAASAVALLALSRALTDLAAKLVVRPVVERGIADDPARERKREFAVVDAIRRADALGLEPLVRREPLPAVDGARWAVVADDESTAVAVMRHLWFGGAAPQRPQHHCPTSSAEQRMRDLGMYDTPAAWVHGEWFFAHERVEQIVDRVCSLGWGRR